MFSHFYLRYFLLVNNTIDNMRHVQFLHWYRLLVGFGRACAPVRTRLLSSLPPQMGRCAPPCPSIAAMKYEVPCPPPLPSQLRLSFRQYFGVKDSKLCTGATIRLTFPGFSFLYFLDLFFLSFSSFSSLLFNFFLFFSSYPSHLISSYSSRRCYSASFLLNCLLYYRHEY
jgi:hypothetical protein